MKKMIALAVMAVSLAVAQADSLTLKIEGMSCPKGCVSKVNKALAGVNGVSDKKVEVGKAEVTFDANKVSKKDIVAAIEKAGFKVAN